MKTISSRLTFFYKYIFTTLWIVLFGFGTIGLLLSKDKEGIVFCVAWIIGSIFIYWGCARLKHVKVDSNNIYISNFFKKTEVPLQEIEKISENSIINIHPIWITLKKPTVFGRKIMFMPSVSFFYILRSHPITQELYELANNARKHIDINNPISTNGRKHAPPQTQVH